MEIWLKRITTDEDVELALRSPAKIAEIVVSNHGGRQLDSALATLDLLPECVEAATCPVNGEQRCQIWMGGCIDKDSGIFKVLALGADGVFIGRTALWGLAVDGADGVLKAPTSLKNELEVTMALAGCYSITDIKKSHLARLRPDGTYVKLRGAAGLLDV